MGGNRRRRRRRSNSGAWWRQQYGGMPVWGLGLAFVALVVAVAIAVPAALAPPQRSEAAPRPLPSMYVPEKNPVAVFMGDSYTTGAGSTRGGFVRLVALEQSWKAENLGRGGTGFVIRTDQEASQAQNACGQDSCESYPEMIPAAADLDPDIVVVSGGRNSVGTDREQTHEAVDTFFTQLREALPDATVYVTSPLWDDDAAPDRLAEIAEWEQAAASAIGATYLDIGQPLEGRPEFLVEDGVHPNDEGYAAIADAINAALVG